MTILMEKTKVSEARAADTTTSRSFELKLYIGETAAFGLLLDLSGGASGPEHFRRVRKRLPPYFEWLQVPSEPALSVVDELMPRHPEVLAPLPFGLLVSPRWAAGRQSVEVFVNMAFRRHNELLVRVPAWAKFLMGHPPIERWVALQPHLARLGKVGLIGVETSSTGRRALEVFLRADDLQAVDLKRIATLAGAPSGQLLHLWRSLTMSGGSETGPMLLSVGLTGGESLDVGVTFPAWRAGSSTEIQKRIQLLARLHGLEAGKYLESIEKLRRLTGRAPEHTMLGFSVENGRVRITASLESVIAPASMGRASRFPVMEDVKKLVETVMSDSWSFPDSRT